MLSFIEFYFFKISALIKIYDFNISPNLKELEVLCIFNQAYLQTEIC